MPHPPTIDPGDWERISQSPHYREMIASKTRFVVAATLFFLVYYFALPISVGYFPELMGREVWGVLNLAYIFALSQFAMTWILAYLYMRIANGFDRMAALAVSETLAARGEK